MCTANWKKQSRKQLRLISNQNNESHTILTLILNPCHRKERTGETA
jgi:hypothetical protein